MTHVIHKFALELVGRTTIFLPAKARVLSVANQRETLTLWAAVPTTFEGEPFARVFDSFMTGGEIPDPYATFLGTFLFHDGAFVCHVFETTP